MPSPWSHRSRAAQSLLRIRWRSYSGILHYIIMAVIYGICSTQCVSLLEGTHPNQPLMPRLVEGASWLKRSLSRAISVDRFVTRIGSGVDRCQIEDWIVGGFHKRDFNVWDSQNCSFWFVSCSHSPCCSSCSFDAHFYIFKTVSWRSSVSFALSDSASSFVAAPMRAPST